MNQIVTKEPPSVIQYMADKYGMDKRAFEVTIRETCIPSTEKAKVTNEQFAAFLLVAKEYNLNPLTKEIYAFPARSGGIQALVSIDGWCNIINSRKELDGIEFDDIKDDKGVITAIACKIHRKDRTHPVVAIEYMSECKRATDPWKQWPVRMLRHKSLIQAARYAFGFSGIVDPDEAERIEMVDVTPKSKSIFKNAALRNTWVDQAIRSFENAVDADELIAAKEGFDEKLSQMTEGNNEHDVLMVEEIERRYKRAFDKFQNVDNVAASYGQGFADIGDSAEQELAQEVITAAKLTLSQWQGRLNEAATIELLEDAYFAATSQFYGDEIAVNAIASTRNKRLAVLKKEAA